jgi:S-adenosylmethionine hydrolase
MKLIALLTDYGLSDHYVGVIKGVIKGISPKTEIIDITHEVKAYDVRDGAFLLLQASKFLPRDCVVVAVVDPGVNTRRRAIAVETKERVYLGPDNGLLYPAASREGIVSVYDIGKGPHVLSDSTTFAGRDIFAPAAAHVSSGTALGSLGRKVSGMAVMELTGAMFTEDAVEGMILHIDRFGNAVSNIEGDSFHRWSRGASLFRLRSGYKVAKVRLVSSYQEIRGVGLVVGSGGTLEVSGREERPDVVLSPTGRFSIERDGKRTH